MPYKIIKQADKFCVAKEDTGEAIKGGCHANRAEAVDHLQALYANEAMAAIAASFSIDEEDAPAVDAILAAFQLTERAFSGPIVFENMPTGDKREFSSEAITWDQLPLPLLFQRTSGEGHSGSVVIGRVDELIRTEGSDAIMAKGVILEGIDEADEFLALMEHGAAGGVSVDGDSAQYQVEEVEEEGGQKKVKFSSMRIRGLTAVAIPAFADAVIKLDEETEELADAELDAATEEAFEALTDEQIEELSRKRRKKKIGNRAHTWHLAEEADSTIVASAAPVKPPLEWFMNPLLDGPTALTITPDGQVFGHIALFDTCHIGMPKCTKPPKGGTYNYFHTGELQTDDNVNVAVGHLTFDTGHASIYDNAFNAASHYDNTGYVGADVIAGEDKFGVWVAGALRPELTDEQVRKFQAAPISGDWRRIGNKMELVAALSVNTPGFPVPRTRALVASGQMETEAVIIVEDEDTFSDLHERSEFRSFLLNKVRGIFEEDAIEEAEAKKAALALRVNPVELAVEAVELAHEHDGGADYDHEDPIESAIYHLKLALENPDEIFTHVQEALDALEEENTYDENEEDYADDDEGDYTYDADTEEFATCSAARKRVRKARRSLRKALRALRRDCGVRVIITPPASGMSAEGVVEMADLEMIELADGASSWEIVNWGGAKPYCVKPRGLKGGNGSSDALSKPLSCFKTEEEATAHMTGLAAPSAEYLAERKPMDEVKAEAKAAKSAAKGK